MKLIVSIRRWWKCSVRKLHFYRFVHKNEDGSRLLRCSRCGAERTTRARRKPMVEVS